MRAVGRSSCDAYAFADTYEDGARLPASRRESTYGTIRAGRLPGSGDRQGSFAVGRDAAGGGCGVAADRGGSL
ncbi:hypothetical protein SCATT_p17220 (plasmid) [Streptantibioticus cattleyicolor NRRL 8057 = DSM 46488]|uniref:Uncharacterized protein n=1 Tax=Streptantibioticus cattleyicolor (strain ATCC 35852 / DSM 46488 / JCM 4925 / NBRC 14057 / NRRL 8057) TaxID=1003195 RepID=G8XI09_STREN|nr:hypothetical protein SCATT_p17220 [Streptantibioticus cattleyicolor NRRL 8057 = DSM 46488]